MDLYDMLFQNYITYDRLYAMSSKALYGERVERGEINLFLDLNSFTKRIWYAFPPYEYKNQNVLVASIINACGHYRQYFWTRHMCKTNIYLVWGWNMNTPTELFTLLTELNNEYKNIDIIGKQKMT